MSFIVSNLRNYHKGISPSLLDQKPPVSKAGSFKENFEIMKRTVFPFLLSWPALPSGFCAKLFAKILLKN
jgi:hypothetical protein